MQEPLLQEPLRSPQGFPLNFENLLSFEPIQFELVSHILMFGVGAHLAGLIYFLLSRDRISPRYRMATIISCIIMAASGFMLLRLAFNWQSALSLDTATMLFELDGTIFSNGFRYVNWLITIPLLLTQVVIILDLPAERFWSVLKTLFVAAYGMILTGYVGQFYETTNLTALLVWGAISTVFYVWLLLVVLREIAAALPRMPPEAARVMKAIRVLFVVSWTLYPGGYLVPIVLQSADAVVARQIIYTVADVTSKVVYGILLSRTAQMLSAAAGYEPAFIVRETLRARQA